MACLGAKVASIYSLYEGITVADKGLKEMFIIIAPCNGPAESPLGSGTERSAVELVWGIHTIFLSI